MKTSRGGERVGIEPGQFMMYWAIGCVLLIWLVFGRPRRRGVHLKLTGQRSARGVARTTSTAEVQTAAPAVVERPLNVIFQFNGHSWDAYEVLGLPAGSNYESVCAAFEESLESIDPTSRPFVEAAFRAITAAVKP